MKKKVSKKTGAPTALGHDPLAWIDVEETADEVEPEVKEEVMEVEVTETEMNNETDESIETAQQDEPQEAVVEEILGVEPEEESSCHSVVLESNLGIAQVESFHQVLLSALNKATEVSIDVQALEQIDGAGVQLLYVFIHDAQKNDIKVSWVSTSEALNKSAGQLGLKEHMGL